MSADTERTYIFRQISLQVHVPRGEILSIHMYVPARTLHVFRGAAAVVSVEAEQVHVVGNQRVIYFWPLLKLDLAADPSRDCPLWNSATWRPQNTGTWHHPCLIFPRWEKKWNRRSLHLSVLGLAQGEGTRKKQSFFDRPRTVIQFGAWGKESTTEGGRIHVDRKIESRIPGGLHTRDTTNRDGGGRVLVSGLTQGE